MTDLIALARESGAFDAYWQSLGIKGSADDLHLVEMCKAAAMHAWQAGATFAARIAKAPEDERAAFEAWVGSLESWIPSIKRGRHGYESNTTAAAWHAWEKRASLPPAHQAGGEGWQPIETAPSDVVVLVYSPHRHESNPERIDARVYHDSRAGSRHAWATHWMPLPPAPSALAAKGVGK